MRVTVVGCGYVGLVTGACLASIGHEVICADTDRLRVAKIAAGDSPIFEPGLDDLLQSALRSHHLSATTDIREASRDRDFIFISVGTPSTPAGIDLSQIRTATEQVGGALGESTTYTVVVVKSTVVPGTTATTVRPTLEMASGRRVGDFGICMNPEFLREGTAVSDFTYPDRIVIGEVDKQSGDRLLKLYDPYDCEKIRTSLENAELIKYASNALLATLISFANEVAGICEVTEDSDIETVMNGVFHDRRMSVESGGRRLRPDILEYLRAGCGFGGSCLPKDVGALISYAQSLHRTPHLLKAVVQVNQERPERIINLAESVVGRLSGQVVSVLGLAFKPGTGDSRESPAVALISELHRRGAQVRVHDPYVRRLPDHCGAANLCGSAEEVLDGADMAFVATAWPEYSAWDWPVLIRLMRRPIVVDGRNALRATSFPPGTHYVGVGQHPTRATVPNGVS